MTNADRDKLLIELASAMVILIAAFRLGPGSRVADSESLTYAQRQLQALLDKVSK
jgi:hypothetical protein